jgi:hypothetical protein
MARQQNAKLLEFFENYSTEAALSLSQTLIRKHFRIG